MMACHCKAARDSLQASCIEELRQDVIAETACGCKLAKDKQDTVIVKPRRSLCTWCYRVDITALDSMHWVGDDIAMHLSCMQKSVYPHASMHDSSSPLPAHPTYPAPLTHQPLQYHDAADSSANAIPQCC